MTRRCLLIASAGVAMLGMASRPAPHKECFLLYEVGVGDVRRHPATLCAERLTPASTFKIPHALAALDAGVVAGPDQVFKWDGQPRSFDAWQHDHTLASAMRYSVVWYFQKIAEKLGMAREREYLKRFDYGNQDPSSNLTAFWLGQSLKISPDEELRFLKRLYADDLPVKRSAMATVKEILVQPRGVVVNASGEHPFAAPWADNTVVSAKTGAGTDLDGRSVRWLVGHVRRGSRAWLFVSAVTGGEELPPMSAVDLAASALRDAGVLR